MTGATFQVVTLTLTPTLTLTLIEVVLISQQFYPRPQKGSIGVYQQLWQYKHLKQEGFVLVQVVGFLLHPPLGASQVLEVLC